MSSSNFPLDLIEREILPHLSMKALHRFRSVCKDWRRVIEPHANKFKKAGHLKDVMAKLNIASAWLEAEMKPGETVRQTVARFEKEAADYSDEFKVNVQNLKYLNEDVESVKLWQGDILDKTKDEVNAISEGIYI